MQFFTKRETAIKCPHGCGRYILPSRLATHALVSAVEHDVAKVASMQFSDAYSLLCRAVTVVE